MFCINRYVQLFNAKRPCTWKDFGQMPRFRPERCYVMHKKLSELEGNGWHKKKEFRELIKVFEGIGGGEAGKD